MNRQDLIDAKYEEKSVKDTAKTDLTLEILSMSNEIVEMEVRQKIENEVSQFIGYCPENSIVESILKEKIEIVEYMRAKLTELGKCTGELTLTEIKEYYEG